MIHKRTLASSSSTTGIDASRFDEVVERRFTGSVKWDKFASGRESGNVQYPNGLLPMWVADAEFKAPDAVINAIKRRADHGVFGYVVGYCVWAKRRLRLRFNL